MILMSLLRRDTASVSLLSHYLQRWLREISTQIGNTQQSTHEARHRQKLDINSVCLRKQGVWWGRRDPGQATEALAKTIISC